jgi:outer membrane protein assembly factor BamB
VLISSDIILSEAKKMRKLLVISLAFCMVLLILMGSGQGEAGTNMFRGDLRRSGIYDSKVPDNSTLLWSFNTGENIESSPVFYEGRIYVGSDSGRLYCLDAFTGLEIWSFRTENEIESTPLVVDGVVYFGSADMNLYAVDADSGDELWKFSFESTHGQITSSPAIVDDKIYVGTKDGNMYSINATTHLQEWSFSTAGEILSSPTVHLPYVYFGSLDGKLYCLWAENGSENWNFSSDMNKLDNGIYGSPLISNSRVYIGSEDLNFYCLDSQNGSLIWNFSSPFYIYSSASAHDGKVFVHGTDRQGLHNGRIFTLPENDPNGDGKIESSEVIWAFETKDWEGGSSPAIADGKVIVGSTDDNLYCLNESTGELIWNFTTAGDIVSSPLIANGIVYISSLDDNVYAIGGSGPVNLEIEIIAEFDSLKSDRIMGISFLVTNRGVPVEGAFVTVDVTLGNLSQFGASTFPDGTQRIKYTAPEVHENVTVSAHATATKYGFPDGESSISFTIVPSSSYGKVSSQSGFSLVKYGFNLGLILILIIVNLIIIVVRFRKRKVRTDDVDSD